jgi:DNA repair ATPase RecN
MATMKQQVDAALQAIRRSEDRLERIEARLTEIADVLRKLADAMHAQRFEG